MGASQSAISAIFLFIFNDLIYNVPSTHTRTHILFMNETQLCPPNGLCGRSVSICFQGFR
jgi:hypothetical protein